jgi:carboxyl-terminal processing protease
MLMTTRKILRCLVACWLLALPIGALAQDRTPTLPSSVNSGNDIASVLQQGLEFESQQRWSDALNHYEEALKQYPSRAELRQKLQVARTHYDLHRRYNDNSFTQSLIKLSAREALEVYDEVLQKIQTHHFQSTNWQAFARRGALNLDVALTEPAFVKHSTTTTEIRQLDLFRQELAQLPPTTVNSKEALREYALQLSRAGAQRIGLSQSAALLEFTCAATASLDEYSGFLTGSQIDELFSQIEGNFVGLGVELKAENQELLIVSVIPGGPAERGGLQAGDHILAVNGKSTTETSTDAVADMLRGEEGTPVDVTFRSGDNAPRTLRFVRRRVDVPSVDEVKMLDRETGVGYFRITSFQKTTSKDVDAALWKLHGEGFRSLIIDLRGNPGGLLKAAVDVADKFVTEGMIVSTRGRSQREDFDHRAQVVGTWRVPLVVLIDRDSASASEILAGAIRDHRRGTLVGEKSYGKGSVQGIFPLTSSNAGVRLTTAQWFTPSGQAISGQGVAPDVTVRTVAKPVDGKLSLSQDTILQAGMQAARDLIAKRAKTASVK